MFAVSAMNQKRCAVRVAAVRRFALLVSLLALPVSLMAAQKPGEEGEENEEAITQAQLPAAVRATLDRELMGGAVEKVEKKTGEGKTLYEADVKVGEDVYEIKIADSGKLLSKALEQGEENEEQEEKEKAVKENENEENEEHEAKAMKEAKERPGEEGEAQEIKGSEKVWSFDADKEGVHPATWQVAETKGVGTPATWKIVADADASSKPNVLEIKTNNPDQVFNILLAKGTSYKDLELSVKVKAMSGNEDQGGGVVWRAKDGNNYYIARWNPLENNIRVYYVKDGRRTQLKSAEVKTDPKAWHEIEVSQVGNRIRVELDGKLYLEAEDSTIPAAGMIGLWTKADASSAFDDFSVVKLEPKSEKEQKSGK